MGTRRGIPGIIKPGKKRDRNVSESGRANHVKGGVCPEIVKIYILVCTMTIKDEIEDILGDATIFSMNRFTDAIVAEPGKYPGIENIFALEQRQARQKMSNTFRALGYKRWNSAHGKRTNCGVWTK